MISITTLLITAFATSACTTPTVVDKQFGDSARNMIKQQVYYTESLRHPPEEQLQGQNAQKAMLDMQKIYRISDTSKEEAKTPVIKSSRAD